MRAAVEVHKVSKGQQAFCGHCNTKIGAPQATCTEAHRIGEAHFHQNH